MRVGNSYLLWGQRSIPFLCPLCRANPRKPWKMPEGIAAALSTGKCMKKRPFIVSQAFMKGRRRALGSPWPFGVEKPVESGALHSASACAARSEVEVMRLPSVTGSSVSPAKEAPDALTASASSPDLAAWHESPAADLAWAVPSLSAHISFAQPGAMPGQSATVSHASVVHCQSCNINALY
jgi:hypothetical protein